MHSTSTPTHRSLGAHRRAEIGRGRQAGPGAERERERMDRPRELDGVSQAVLTGVVRALEQRLWMVRVRLDGAGAA